MSKATLPQALSLLTRVNDKGLSSARLEAHFDTGLISDLLDVDPRKVNRAEFRKVIGHPEVLPIPTEKPKDKPTIVELGEFEVNYDETIAEKIAGNADPKRIVWHNREWVADKKYPDKRTCKKLDKASAVNFWRLMPDEGDGSVAQWCKDYKKIRATPKEGIDLALVNPRPKLDKVMPLALAGQFFVGAGGNRDALFFNLRGGGRNLYDVWLDPGVQWSGDWWFLVLEELPSEA